MKRLLIIISACVCFLFLIKQGIRSDSQVGTGIQAFQINLSLQVFDDLFSDHEKIAHSSPFCLEVSI